MRIGCPVLQLRLSCCSILWLSICGLPPSFWCGSLPPPRSCRGDSFHWSTCWCEGSSWGELVLRSGRWRSRRWRRQWSSESSYRLSSTFSFFLLYIFWLLSFRAFWFSPSSFKLVLLFSSSFVVLHFFRGMRPGLS